MTSTEEQQQQPPPPTPKDHDAIRSAVKESYAKRVTTCRTCGPHAPIREDRGCCTQKAAAATDLNQAAEKMGYTAQDLETVPAESNLGLGCGAPLQKAGVQPGMTVLDLGSGAGFDAFLAAHAVGPTGRVIGVDMTPEMVQKAVENARKKAARATAPQPVIEFREGLIEDLPLEDNLVDVVISNCVIALSPDKEAVFREAHRVLKPGGKICVSDIVVTRPLPPKIRDSLAVYMGCIAGAALMDDYVGAIRQAGFENLTITTKQAFDVLVNDDPVLQGIREGLEEGPDSIRLDSLQKTVVSATVIAYKSQ